MRDDVTPGRAFTFIASQPWAILEENLEIIASIAQRTNDEPEAVAAKLGKPLKNARTVSMRGTTAIIPVIGPIFRYANWMTEISGATSVQILAQDFTKALEDPTVNAIVLEVDSPGGMVSGVSEFADMVYEARAKKPVVAYVSDVGASAGYWIASAAGQIVLSNTAKVGSIGAITTYDKRENGHIGQIVSSQSPKKAPDLTKNEGRAQVQALVDSLADVFVQTVARNRGVSEETVLADFGQGDLFVGAQAVEAGLADSIGSLEGVLSDLASSKTVQKKSNGEKVMTVEGTQAITREFILANHSDISDGFRAEGKQQAEAGLSDKIAAARTEAAEQERKRIQDVEAQAMAGHEALIAELKFDGKTTGPEAAVKVLAAEKQKCSNHLQTLKNEAPKPVDASLNDDLPTTATEQSTEFSEEACKAKWDKSADIRTEFGTFEAYKAYCKAESKGQVYIRK